MAWNEPGGPKEPGKDRDPWGSGNDQGPPDLDAVVRQIQDRLRRMFGMSGRGPKGPGGGGGHPLSMGLGIILLVILVVWGVSGFYTIDQADRGVVTRFGRYVETTDAGLHWHLPYPIESVEIVNVEQIRNVEIGYRSGVNGQGMRPIARESLMLTQDENIVDLKLAVQYRVKDAKDYLFNVRNPDETLHQATESAIREIVGKNKMDFVLTQGRNEIVSQVHDLTQSILDHYEAGLLITSVNMQDAQPPEEVQGAFNDAVKAREDEVRLKNEAEAYANDILPKARGAAARALEEANAYRSKVTLQAQGDANRFSLVRNAYEQAPEVTRQRLYLDALEAVLGRASKVLVDVKEGNNLLYLPIDRWLSGSAVASRQQVPLSPASADVEAMKQAAKEFERARGGRHSAKTVDRRSREALRAREVR